MTRLVPLLALAAAPAIAAAHLAAAQPAAPQLVPSRDVVVRYQVEGEATSLLPGGLPGPVTVSWDAANQRLRAEAQGRNQIAVLELRSHTGEVFDTALRVVVPLRLRPGTLQSITLEGARLQPRGRDVVAGMACTTYAVEGRTPGTVCLTPDGVALRGDGEVEGKPGRFVALSVSYGAVPPTAFAPPPGYMSLSSGKDGGGGLDLRSLGRSLLGQGSR